jgi:hypothetical protein
MRAPIKINRAWLARPLWGVLPSADDPRVLGDPQLDEGSFSRAVSTFKFGATFKTTQKQRFPLTLEALARLHFAAPPVVLDVGASDGITSVDVMQRVPFRKYYVTDLNVEVRRKSFGRRTFFYDSSEACILIVDDWWIYYPDTRGAVAPLGWLARAAFRRAPQPGPEASRLSLVNPSLQRMLSERVVATRYDMYEAWQAEKVDLLIAANVLNRVYFTERQLHAALRIGGEPRPAVAGPVPDG